MQIVNENGKDYLVSYIAKIDNSTIDAQDFFIDLQETINRIVAGYNAEHKTRFTYIKEGYGAGLQSFMNKYSGNYLSPSFMKGYITNPGLNLVENFFAEGVNDATRIGSLLHLCLEIYYNLPPKERVRAKLWEIEKEVLKDAPGTDKEKLDKYIEGYLDIKDYLHPRKELNDTKLMCLTEHRGRVNDLYVKDLGWKCPCAVSYVADRIDFRDGEVVILDYKTGNQDAKSATFDGYLGSMILYKWAMEQELNSHPDKLKEYGLSGTVEITKGYLICPGNTASKKYIELDYSKENQEKLKEKIDRFYKNFMRDNRSRIYTFTGDGYFTSEDAKKFRTIMMDNTIWMSKLPIKLYIGEHADSTIPERFYISKEEVDAKEEESK